MRYITIKVNAEIYFEKDRGKKSHVIVMREKLKSFLDPYIGYSLTVYITFLHES